MKEYVVKTHEIKEGAQTPTPIPMDELVTEKLASDILNLCGVYVPKTYLVLNKESTQVVGFASERVQEAVPLSSFIPNIGTKSSGEDFFSKRQINEKPILDLYQWLPLFVYLLDFDGLGGGLSNILLLENNNGYQAIKCDVGNAKLGKFFDEAETREFFFNSADEPRFGMNNDIPHGCLLNLFKLHEEFRFVDVYSYATRDEIMSGLKTVASITNDQLRQIIYNTQIPEFALSQKKRNEYYDSLIKRRDWITRFYANSLKDFQGNFFQPDIVRVKQFRYCLNLEIDLRVTQKIIEAGKSRPTIYHKVPLALKSKTDNELSSEIKNWVESCLTPYQQGVALLSILHGKKGLQRANNLNRQVQQATDLNNLLHLLITHFNRKEGWGWFKHSGRLRDKSLDTALLNGIFKQPETASIRSAFGNFGGFSSYEVKNNARKRLVTVLSTKLSV